jgi:hypothetical protein
LLCAFKSPPSLNPTLFAALLYNEYLGMPRDGAIIFGDLIGKLPVLRVSCSKCGRAGQYQLQRLIRVYGRDTKMVDWLDVITADCPKKIARNMNGPCGAKCPQLPKVFKSTGTKSSNAN